MSPALAPVRLMAALLAAMLLTLALAGPLGSLPLGATAALAQESEGAEDGGGWSDVDPAAELPAEPAAAAEDSAAPDDASGQSAESSGEILSVNPPPASIEPCAEALSALRHAAKLPSEAGQDSRKVLKDILARPEFLEKKAQAKPKTQNWLQRILQAIQQWLSRLGLGVVAGSQVATVIAVVLVGLLLLLLVYLLVRWIWDAVATGRVIKAPLDEKAEDELEPDALLRLAQQAFARGEVRQAIRLRFKAVLRRLPQTASTVLLTNSQLARRLAREYPQAAQPFKRLVLCFEDAWYGGMQVGPADFNSADGWAREVEQLVPLASATEEVQA
ncbi:DUF4129 domain-containing protein [bacterium]|nr:DUF4129 domain-containing protein [bacterium]